MTNKNYYLIHVKNIICSSNDTVLGTTYPDIAYGLLFSDLVSNMYLGSVYLNSQYQSQTIHNIRYCFKTPQKIGGTYNFTLGDIIQDSYPVLLNNMSTWDNYPAGDLFHIALVLEFIAENSADDLIL